MSGWGHAFADDTLLPQIIVTPFIVIGWKGACTVEIDPANIGLIGDFGPWFVPFLDMSVKGHVKTIRYIMLPFDIMHGSGIKTRHVDIDNDTLQEFQMFEQGFRTKGLLIV